MGIGPGNLASMMPARESDMARGQRDLTRGLREQSAALTGAATQIGSGGLLINDGGSITIDDGGSLNIIGGGALNVPSGGLNSAGSINATTDVTAGGDMTAGGTVSGAALATGGAITGASVTVTGAATADSGTFGSALTSAGAYLTDVSALPGGRQSVWQHNTGVYGFVPSTRTAKDNLTAVPFTAADARAVSPYLFQYKTQAAIRSDPTNPNFDPTYTVPWDIGVMAEDLIAHNMACFVFFEDDGTTPKGVNYDLFGAVVPLVLDADIDARLRAAGL